MSDMELTRLTLEEASRIPQLVEEVSEKSYGGNIILHPDSRLDSYPMRFRITVRDSRKEGSRRSASWSNPERRVKASCWHAYRDVLARVFTEFPHARISTMHANYDGRESFRRLYPATGRRNVGAPIYPVTYPELCDCWEGNSDTWREEA